MFAPPHNRAHRVAIVGAGPGGLAAGILLAARGVDVTIYEKQPMVGGRTGQVRVGGYQFDLGPTFYLMPYVLQEIFQTASKDLYQELELTRLDPMYRLVVGQPDGSDVTIDATQDIDEITYEAALRRKRAAVRRKHLATLKERQLNEHGLVTCALCSGTHARLTCALSPETGRPAARHLSLSCGTLSDWSPPAAGLPLRFFLAATSMLRAARRWETGLINALAAVMSASSSARRAMLASKGTSQMSS